MAEVRDVAWAAGLLEGDGCFALNSHWQKGKRYAQHKIILAMSDKDVVEKAAKLFGVEYHKHTTLKSGKVMWRLNVYGKKAIGWMMTLYPLMGIRRQAKIKEILAAWKER